MEKSWKDAGWFVIGLVLMAALYRVLSATVVEGLPNFSPVMAIAFCGGIFLGGWRAWVIPLALLMISDAILSLALGYPLVSWGALAAWACAAGAIYFGKTLSRAGRVGLWSVLVGLVSCSLGFYLVTNSVCWLADAGYTKTWAGWLQALTVGLPGYSPTWVFFRNSLVSDLLFGLLIYYCWLFALEPARRAVTIS